FQQILDARALAGFAHGMARARRDSYRTVSSRERRPCQGVESALDDARRGRLVRAVDDHEELVAAEPSDDIRPPHARDEALADPAQHLVSGLMSERIVDVFEVVQIEKSDPDRRAGAIGVLKCRL